MRCQDLGHIKESLTLGGIVEARVKQSSGKNVCKEKHGRWSSRDTDLEIARKMLRKEGGGIEEQRG